MGKKFAYALESDTVVDDVVPPVEEPTPEVSDTDLLESATEVEEQHDEVVEGESEIGDMGEAIDEGAEASEPLMDLNDVMQDAVDEGTGISPETAEVAEITIESMRRRLGYKKNVGKQPTLESFTSARGRPEATRLALEEVKGAIGTIWKRIIEICGTILEKIKSYLGTLLKNYESVGNHLKSLKAKAESVEGEPEKAELDKGALAKFFSHGNKAGPETVKETLKTAGTFQAVSEKVLGFIAGHGDVEKLATMTPEEAGKQAGETLTALTEAFKASGLTAKGENGVVVLGPLPGDQYIHAAVREGRFEVEFESGKDGAKVIGAAKKEDLNQILDMAIQEATTGPELKKQVELSEAALKKISEAASSIMNHVANEAGKEGDEGKAKGESLKAASAVANAFSKTVMRVSGKLPSLHFATVKHAGDYVQASISNFKAKAAEAAPAAPAAEPAPAAA